MDEYISLESIKNKLVNVFARGIRKHKKLHDILVDDLDAIDEAPAADVAPVWHGAPIIKRRTFGGFRSYTDVDAMGETHTITVDERIECNARHCPECQAILCSRFENYCPRRSAKMDLEV